MTADPDTRVPDARELRSLWVGLLLPPLAFLANLEIAYALVPGACASRNALSIHLVHLVSLLLALAGGATAWWCWIALGARWPRDEGDPLARSRFLAGTGMLVSGLFALIILAQWIPAMLLHPCQ